MRAIAIERIGFEQYEKVTDWLIDTYGPAKKRTWYVFQDYDLMDLVMNDEIYTMYMLRWGDE